MSHPVISPKKLIEVALPLDAINVASAREKSIRHGHPSTLHLWWARRPLATARAVIFAQMVNDPSWRWDLEHPGEVPPNNLKGSWAASRKRLFDLIEKLVLWENTTNEEVLEQARREIRKSWVETCEVNRDHPDAAELFDPDKLPAFHDPFAGGGALPLEAQRLGLEAYASDLNPVAVLINKAMIEIPPKFAGQPPVNPDWQRKPAQEKATHQWKGAQGLAEDVRYYGQWMRDEAEKRIGHLYPKVEVTAEMAKERPDLKQYVGKKLTVIAWLWARTVKSPNPAFSDVEVPLASTFMLSTKPGKEAYVEPVIEDGGYRFTVKVGPPRDAEAARNGTKLARGANFRCVCSGTPIEARYIRAEAQAGRMGCRLMAVVADGDRGRVYLPPIEEHARIAHTAKPTWKPDLRVPTPCHDVDRLPMYGMPTWGDAFTPRQLVALTTFSDLVQEARARAEEDARAAGLADDGLGLAEGGCGARGYGGAVGVYAAFLVSQLANHCSSVCGWNSANSQMRSVFARQAIPMVWDYAEGNVFCSSSGSFANLHERQVKGFDSLGLDVGGLASQGDAAAVTLHAGSVVSTDPPYYDNIGYADLSDFFYVWLRRALRSTFPLLFQTMDVPKAAELVASPYRHGSKVKAEEFFLTGMTHVLGSLGRQAHPSLPVTIYYAFKQAEGNERDGHASTGWETFLAAVLRAELSILGTWPMRTEKVGRVIGNDTNALASSIVLVCRKRDAEALTVSRREFLRELNRVMPEALDDMTKGSGDGRSPVAPVDLSQALIGPGMAVFSKYEAVLEADGSPMTVRSALQAINRFLATDDFDADTQFCLQWFEQHGWAQAAYGEADVLARAKATSVDGLSQAGVLESGSGQVRLLPWAEYPAEWDPRSDTRLPVWEALHHLIRLLRNAGESGAGEVLAAVSDKATGIHQLAYRLYTLCERAGWAEDARAYNDLVTSWDGIEASASQVAASHGVQGRLFDI